MMKKIVFCSTLIAASVVAIQHSQAIGGESLGCFVDDGTPASFSPGSCAPAVPRTSYTAKFRVLGGSGSYSYAWTVDAPILDGCTSTSDYCFVNVVHRNDYTITASVTLTQAGQQTTVSAVAEIPSICFLGSTPTFC